MTLKVIKESNLGWSSRIITKINKFAPNGKPISEKQILAAKNLGLRVDGITETESLVCAIDVGSGYALKNLSIDGVKCIKTIIEKFYNGITITEDDITDLHEQIRVTKSVTCKPFKITLEGGEVINLDKNEAYYFADKLPSKYKSVVINLNSICGYSLQTYGSDIKVGCHYHNYNRMMAHFNEVISFMEEPVGAQTSI